mgnify:CR=1 FL=1
MSLFAFAAGTAPARAGGDAPGRVRLERVARACVARTDELVAALTRIDGIRAAFAGPRFHEAVLQFDRPVAPLLEIEDPRTDKRIDFVGGIRGTGELEKLVNQGKAAVAFSMFPVGVDDLMRIADAGEIKVFIDDEQLHLLDRHMEAKGYLAHDVAERTYVYRATISRQNARRF